MALDTLGMGPCICPTLTRCRQSRWRLRSVSHATLCPRWLCGALCPGDALIFQGVGRSSASLAPPTRVIGAGGRCHRQPPPRCTQRGELRLPGRSPFHGRLEFNNRSVSGVIVGAAPCCQRPSRRPGAENPRAGGRRNQKSLELGVGRSREMLFKSL